MPSLLARISSKRPGGQIATFLLLLVMVVLIFALVVMNLGRVASSSTTVANAADGAALSIASQLASRSNQLCYGIGKKTGECLTERCQKTGILPVVLAVIAAVVVTIATGGFGAPLSMHMVTHMLLPAIIAGAAGGAIGGAITGTGTVKGALWGAMIGAGIAGASGIAGHGFLGHLGTVAKTPLQVTLSGAATLGDTTIKVAAASAVYTGLGSGLAAGFAGAVAADAIHQNYMIDQAIGERFATAAKALNGLPDYEQIREGALFQALAQTVDDPNFTGQQCHWVDPAGTTLNIAVGGDPFDSDADGNTREKIPCFQYWWDRRSQLLIAGLKREGPGDIIRLYLDSRSGLITEFRNRAREFLHELERTEIECPCKQTETGVNPEGRLMQVWRAFDKQLGTGAVGFWKPGPDQAGARAWYELDTCPSCDTTPPPEGWDSADAVRLTYEQLLEYLKALIWNVELFGGESEAAFIYELRYYQNWFPHLYNPTQEEETNGSFHTLFGAVLDGDDGLVGMRKWPEQTLMAQSRLPGCSIDYGSYPAMESVTSRPPDPPTCANEEPIDNCTWDQPEVATENGVHFRDNQFTDPAAPPGFPGPTCKIDAGHRTNLLNQMAAVGQRVKELPAYIAANLQRLVPVTCAEGAFDPDSVKVSNLQVALDNPPATLKYRFDYSYKCAGIGRACNDAKELACGEGEACPTCECDPNSPGPNCRLTSSNITRNDSTCVTCDYCCATGLDPITGLPVCTATCQAPVGSCSFEKSNVYACRTEGQSPVIPEDIAAPNVRIPSPLMPAGTFLGILGQMQATVRPLPFSFATINADTKDELTPLLELLDDQVRYVQGFRSNLEAMYAQLQGLSSKIPPAQDGRLPNPNQLVPPADWPLFGTVYNGRYAWEDTHGQHTVEVEIGPFHLAFTEKRKHGSIWKGRVCLELIDYCDGLDAGDSKNRENCNDKCCYEFDKGHLPGDTFVRITRTDPRGPEMGLLWRLNPLGLRTRKTARVRYHTQFVGLESTRN